MFKYFLALISCIALTQARWTEESACIALQNPKSPSAGQTATAELLYTFSDIWLPIFEGGDVGEDAATYTIPCAEYGDNTDPVLNFADSKTLAKIFATFGDGTSICSFNDMVGALTLSLAGEELSLEAILGADTWKAIEWTCPENLMPAPIYKLFKSLATPGLVVAAFFTAPVKLFIGGLADLFSF